MSHRTARARPRERWLRRLYLPAYAVGEAARLAEVHRTTVSYWYYGSVKPRGGRRAKVLGERERGSPLSYLHLVEVAFVATLRHMGVQLQRIRIARSYLQKAFDTDYPFAKLRLKTDGARVLHDLEEEQGPWVHRLVEASAYGQIIWANPIQERIREFDYDQPRELAIRWFPRGRHAPVVVDPQIQFGAPILKDSGVPTLVIRERYEAGESIKEIEDDFGIRPAAIRYALKFEGLPAVAVA